MKQGKPTFVEEIMHEHQMLKGIMRRLEVISHWDDSVSDGAAWAHLVRDGLLDLRSHLQRHIELEETGGYMREVLKHNPRAHDRVKKLRQEHDHILGSLDDLVTCCGLLVGGVGAAYVEFRHYVIDTLSTIRRHEVGENELLQQTFYQELGTID